MNYPNFENDQLPIVGEKIGAISRWIDESPANRNNSNLENLLLRTTVKIGEEMGELNGALIGLIGQNPRKGVTHSIQDVEKELLDIALTALCGVEHLHINDGQVMARFAKHVEGIRLRMVASIKDHEAAVAEMRQQANAAPNPLLSASLVALASRKTAADSRMNDQ